MPISRRARETRKVRGKFNFGILESGNLRGWNSSGVPSHWHQVRCPCSMCPCAHAMNACSWHWHLHFGMGMGMGTGYIFYDKIGDGKRMISHEMNDRQFERCHGLVATAMSLLLCLWHCHIRFWDRVAAYFFLNFDTVSPLRAPDSREVLIVNTCPLYSQFGCFTTYPVDNVILLSGRRRRW